MSSIPVAVLVLSPGSAWASDSSSIGVDVTVPRILASSAASATTNAWRPQPGSDATAAEYRHPLEDEKLHSSGTTMIIVELR